MAEDQLHLWDQESQDSQPMESATLEQMDAEVQELRKLREDYEEKKDVATQAHDLYEAQRNKVINMLKANKRTKYECEGVASIWIVEKEVYRVPRTNEDKTKLFNYIKDKAGPEALMSMVSINHQTLNSWANKEVESGVMEIPGLESPTMTEDLSMRRK